MPLQAYIDDSGSDPTSRHFVLAGFVSTTERWAGFSDRWRAELDGDPKSEIPKLEYFKATEAANLRKQFSIRHGWNRTKRDAKVMALAQILRDAGMIRVVAAMRNDHFEKHIKSIPLPERRMGSDSPYLLLFYNLILAIADRGSKLGLVPPCDFIFDRQIGFEDDALIYWPSVRAAALSYGRSDMAGWAEQAPVFRDDKCSLPLQGADLYAWNIRRKLRENEVLWMPPGKVLALLEPIPEASRQMDEQEIIRLRRWLLEVGERLSKEHPGMPLLYASKGAPKRARNAAKRARAHAEPKGGNRA